jgi:polyisoprenoid-binding protein YceI
VLHPLHKREVCGADAHGRFDRSDFGMNIGLPRFSPEIKLAIQVEGIKAD